MGMFSRVASVLLVCLPLAGQKSETPRDGAASFTANSELVLVDALVTEKKSGRWDGAVSASGFELSEDGVPRPIRYFSRDTLPLSVLLLFDLTESVQPVLKPLAAGAREALDRLKPGDEVAVMTYAASAELVHGFTTNRTTAVEAIEKASEMKSGEAAFFNEGVYQAAAELGKSANPGNRRVIIWMTDGLPNVPSELNRKTIGRSVPKGQLHTEEEAFAKLFETGTAVCVLLERSGLSNFLMAAQFADPALPFERLHNPPGDVNKYSSQTGGLVLPSKKQEISEKLGDLIDRIRTRYTLGYVPPADGEKGVFHEIRVTLTPEASGHGRLVVHARHGYYR